MDNQNHHLNCIFFFFFDFYEKRKLDSYFYSYHFTILYNLHCTIYILQFLTSIVNIE